MKKTKNQKKQTKKGEEIEAKLNGLFRGFFFAKCFALQSL
jgi:hypothetical protein